MALGEYRPPNQINSDEDKYGYGRITFTKVQILYAIIGLFAGLLIFIVLNLTGLIIFRILGVVIIVAGVLGGVAIGGLTIPNSKYLKGGGLRIDKYLIRKLKKKFLRSQHVVYTSNIDRDKLVTYRSKQINNTGESTNILQDIRSMFGGD